MKDKSVADESGPRTDLDRIIRTLTDERDRIDGIIAALEALVSTGHLSTKTRDPRGRKSMDPASRQKVSERMKHYWAERRKPPHPESGTKKPEGP